MNKLETVNDVRDELIRQVEKNDLQGNTGARVDVEDEAVVVRPEGTRWFWQVFYVPGGRVNSDGICAGLQQAARTRCMRVLQCDARKLRAKRPARAG